MLSHLIGELHSPGPKQILDAACGIGTQSLGLVLCGHSVVGSDLSEAALRRARHEASRLSIELRTQVADMRRLTEVISERFEVIIVLDNSIAHLLNQVELVIAARELAEAMLPGGLLLVSITDYDALMDERPSITLFRVIDGKDGRRVGFQVWDWDRTGSEYGLTQYLLVHLEERVETFTFETRVRAVTRASLSAALEAAGLQLLHWIEPETSGFYQPILAARLP